jgi:large subunit ribosomal protein L6
MSRIGKKPVPIPPGVTVKLAGQQVTVSGPKGNLDWTVPEPIGAVVDGAEVVLTRPNDESRNRALHGLSRALIANMVHGVTQGYVVALEVYGTGYSAKKQGNQLHLNIGYMGRGYGRPAQYMIDVPAGLTVDVQVESARGDTEPAKFTVSGCDKQMVGQFAAEIRKLRKPEPYKGKGIRYAGEQIRRKAGKVFAGGG